MIVVKVEMWPKGIESKKYELTRMFIANIGGTKKRGNYKTAIMRCGQTKAPWKIGYGKNETAKPIRTGEVYNHPRLSQHVLKLVEKAIKVCFENNKNNKSKSCI